MSTSQIVKITQLPTPMEVDNNNQHTHQVEDGRTNQPTHIDRYQYVILNSVALETIDRAWFDAREISHHP